jgi:hypothetical protein
VDARLEERARSIIGRYVNQTLGTGIQTAHARTVEWGNSFTKSAFNLDCMLAIALLPETSNEHVS